MFLKQNKKRLQCIIIRKVLSSTILLTAWFNYMYLIHQRRYGSKKWQGWAEFKRYKTLFILTNIYS